MVIGEITIFNCNIAQSHKFYCTTKVSGIIDEVTIAYGNIIHVSEKVLTIYKTTVENIDSVSIECIKYIGLI